MAQKITTFLMFEGVAEQAMLFYVSLFNDSEVRNIERYETDDPDTEGPVKVAQFTLCGHEMTCSDSPVKHDFTFTPSISLFVDCNTEEELDEAFNRLSDGGSVLMPPDNYGFSKKFAWVNDRYGVSWQLNLA